MAVAIQAKAYLDKAAAGEPLTADERRHAVLFVQGQNPGVSQRQLAEMFGVSETQIRKDIGKNKEALTEEAKASYMETAVQDLIHEQHNIHKGIQASLVKAPPGTRVHLDHLMALLKVRHETIRILQEIGVLPKSLGEVAVKKERFIAEVAPGTNQVVTRPLDMFDGFEDGEGLKDAIARKERENAMEEELALSVIALSSSVDMNGQDSNQT